MAQEMRLSNFTDDKGTLGSETLIGGPYAPDTVVRATAAMTPEQAAQTRQNIGADTPETVTAWLDEHVDPDTGYVIDNSLTVEGAAADAKATGDAVGELKSAIGDISKEIGYEELPLLMGKSITNKPGSTVLPANIVSESGFCCLCVECNEGDSFIITGSGGNDTRLWAFSDVNGSILRNSLSQQTATNIVLVAPKDAKYFAFNSKTTGSIAYSVYKGIKPTTEFENLRKADNDAANTTEASTGAVNKGNYAFEVGDISMSVNGWTYSASNYRVRTAQGVAIRLYPGDKIKLTSYASARFSVGRLSLSGNYGVSEWMQEDYTVLIAGDYVLLLDFVPQKFVNNVHELLDLLVIEKAKNVANVYARGHKAANIKTINHQGFNRIAPQNTLPAFMLSREMGFDWVECDIRFTSDGVPVLLHDASIDATSDGTGNIADMTFAEAREFDFGSWKSADYAGTKIPSYEEFLALCKYAGLDAYCELKTGTQAQIESVVDSTIAYAMTEHIIFISTSDVLLSYVKAKIPTATLGVIIHSNFSDGLALATSLKTDNNKVFVTVNQSLVTSENVESAITAGIPMGAFVVNSVLDLEAFDPYVSIITTDVLDCGLLLYQYAQTLTN